MNILIFKEPKGPDDPYLEALKEFGPVHFCPALNINFLNHKELESLISKKDYDSIIFTSGNAVKAVRALVESIPAIATRVTSIKCYVVGKATQKLACEMGFTCSGSHSGNAEELANLIIRENGSDLQKKFLFPCGQMKREVLPTLMQKAGLDLTSVTVYETGEHPDLAKSILEYANKHIGPTIAIFFSPSGVKFSLPKLMDIYGENLKDLNCAAIGKTTAEALENAGVTPCCVAGCPTPNDLATAIKIFIDSNK